MSDAVVWNASPAQTAWHVAMAAQDTHEIFDCLPCHVAQTPVCAEGMRLQADARRAHEAWVSERWGYVIEPWARGLAW